VPLFFGRTFCTAITSIHRYYSNLPEIIIKGFLEEVPQNETRGGPEKCLRLKSKAFLEKCR
jgi:hypothetical protein